MYKHLIPTLVLVTILGACSSSHEPPVSEADPALAAILVDYPEALLADPLLREALGGRAGGVRRLVEQGRDIDAVPTVNQVLVFVVHQSQCAPDVVEALVESGAEPTLVDEDTGMSVLLSAAGSGAGDCFRTLISQGADPARLDGNGYGVISQAYLSGNLSFFRWALGSDEVAPKQPKDLSRALQATLLREDWTSCGKLLEAGAVLAPLLRQGRLEINPKDVADINRCSVSSP